jgi:hypothetical protein
MEIAPSREVYEEEEKISCVMLILYDDKYWLEEICRKNV